MSDYTLEQFCADAQGAIRKDKGNAGRETIRKNLGRLLANPAFIAEHCSPDAPRGTNLLYRDPEFGFDVLAHCFDKGAKSPPHDHGPSWAIYGQARGHTDVTVWQRKDDGKKAGHAELGVREEYRLNTGDVGCFHPGDIHTVDFTAGSRYIRVTGTDLNAVDQAVYDLKRNAVKIGNPAAAIDSQALAGQ